jgi:hypothetical protein
MLRNRRRRDAAWCGPLLLSANVALYAAGVRDSLIAPITPLIPLMLLSSSL